MTPYMVAEAAAWAAWLHRNDKRKGAGIPYIVHSLEVGRLVAGCGCAPEVVVAAYLHDTKEDGHTTINEIRERFGTRVAYLVEAVSKPLTPAQQPLKSARLQAEREHYWQGDDDAQTLKCADIFENISPSILDLDRQWAYDYVHEKWLILPGLVRANANMRERAITRCSERLRELHTLA